MSSIVENTRASLRNRMSSNGASVHMSVCKKCIMFVILCPLFVGKLRALMYAINPNEQAVSRIYGGRTHGWYMITDRSYQRSMHQMTHSSSRRDNKHACCCWSLRILSFFKASYHDKIHFYWSFEIIEFHILCKHTLTCTQWPTKKILQFVVVKCYWIMFIVNVMNNLRRTDLIHPPKSSWILVKKQLHA